MKVLFWILQSLLAFIFLLSGLTKLTQKREMFRKALGPWTEDFSLATIKLIGAFEFLGAGGVILPDVLGIAPILTPIACIGLALIMIGAFATHSRRREFIMLPVTFAILALAVLVAIIRY